MRCKHCGESLTRGAAICPKCGTPVKRKNKTLLSVLFVFLFVVLVSGALIFLNLRGRGDLPNLNMSAIRSLFTRDSSAEPAVTELPEPDPTVTESSEAAPESPSAAEEPAAEQEEEQAESDPAVTAPAAAEAEAQDTGALTPLEAYQAAERRSFALLQESWAACRGADAQAADKLLRGDGALLLRLCLNLALDDEMQSRLLLLEAEGWSLFADGADADANAPFRALLASEDGDALLGDCFELALSNITEVTEAPETLEAEGIVERCGTCYSVDLDADTLHRIASSVIASLRWDERIDAILGEEDSKALRSRLDELDYKLDSTKGSADPVLHMVLYVNEKEEFCGRSFSFERENRPERFLLALPRDGEILGLELSLRDSAGLRTLTGRGSVAESSFTGSFRFLRDGKSLASVSVETAA